MSEKFIIDILVVIWLIAWIIFIANKNFILFCSYQLIENNYDPIIILARKYNINSIHFTNFSEKAQRFIFGMNRALAIDFLK